jgi:hypothetical protein
MGRGYSVGQTHIETERATADPAGNRASRRAAQRKATPDCSDPRDPDGCPWEDHDHADPREFRVVDGEWRRVVSPVRPAWSTAAREAAQRRQRADEDRLRALAGRCDGDAPGFLRCTADAGTGHEHRYLPADLPFGREGR